MTSRQEVLSFLERWKEASANYIDFVPRQINKECLLKLEININIVKNILRSLNIENYVSGPEKDINWETKDIWIFGYFLKKKEIYIKIKIYVESSMLYAKCISFHEAERTLQYPFRTEAL